MVRAWCASERKSGSAVCERVLRALNFREHWRELERGRPGRRFQDRYDRLRHREGRRGLGSRIVFIAIAVVAFAIGIVLAVIPGPAIPFFVIAGGALAVVSRPMAKAMDWLEVQVRKVWRWGMQRWRKLPGAARVFLMMLGACASVTAAYASIRLFRG
ncbi:MAG: hypothetical protein Q7S40_32655 [Opitutaceae bacterium]|nr:hypothetical protein [Opitutaceae bacterium]